MSGHTSTEPSLEKSILDQIDRMVHDAEQSSRPLEVDPYRSRLFELFVTAEAAGCLKEDPADEEHFSDLTADGICRSLAKRWQLADAARESFTHQTRLPAEHLSRMRLLWSVMRMWMEWTYAWKRWPEFHRETKIG